jgi:hypothetical protein
MKNYKVTVWNTSTNSDLESYEFEAENDKDAIDEMKSNLSPQQDGKSGKYELELFEGDRFVSSIKVNEWV